MGSKIAKIRMGGSVSNFGNSETKSMKSSSVRDAKEDSFDLEDFEDIMEQIQLQGALEEKKRQVRKVNQVREDDGHN